jgi:hypothetical protein
VAEINVINPLLAKQLGQVANRQGAAAVISCIYKKEQFFAADELLSQLKIPSITGLVSPLRLRWSLSSIPLVKAGAGRFVKFFHYFLYAFFT